MDTETDLNFQTLAKDLLNKSLLGATWTSYIDKKQLITMWTDAKDVIKRHPSNKKAIAEANALKETLQRVVRCLCMDDEAKLTTVRGRDILMDAEALFSNAERQLKAMRILVMKK